MLAVILGVGVSSMLQQQLQAACVLLGLSACSQVDRSHTFTAHQVRPCTLGKEQLHRSAKQEEPS